MTKTQQNFPQYVCEWQDIVNDVYSKEALTLSLRQQSTRISSYWGRFKLKDLNGYLWLFIFFLSPLSPGWDQI